jgi:hypothetical protein
VQRTWIPAWAGMTITIISEKRVVLFSIQILFCVNPLKDNR